MRPSAAPGGQVKCSPIEPPPSSLSLTLSVHMMTSLQATSSDLITLSLYFDATSRCVASIPLLATHCTLLTTCAVRVPQEGTVTWRTSCTSMAAGMAWADRSRWACKLRSSLLPRSRAKGGLAAVVLSVRCCMVFGCGCFVCPASISFVLTDWAASAV